MSEAYPDGQGQNSDTAYDGSGMYAEQLAQFPEEYREQAEQIFKEWDGNVTKKFQDYEPYKQFLGYDPQVLAAGVNLLSKVAEDPREVYDLMAQTYGFAEGGQDQMEQPAETPSAEPQVDYSQQIEELRSLIESQQAQNEEQQAMQEFQGLMSNLSEQYGAYDEDYVLAKIAAGVDPEEAVKGYFGLIEQITGQNPLAQNQYPVLGGSGGVPSNEMDFARMGSKETKDIIAQLLMQANQE